MPPRRPLRSSTFLLTVGYLALFCVSTLPVLIIVYLTSAEFIEQQTWDEIDTDLGLLISQYQFGGLPGLQEAVGQRARAAEDQTMLGGPPANVIYGLFDRAGKTLAGNAAGPPPEQDPYDDEGVVRFTVEITAEAPSWSPKRPGLLSRAADLLGVGWGDTATHAALGRLLDVEETATLLVGRDIQGNVATLRYLRFVIGIGTAALLVLGLAGGYVMSRWTLGRLDRVNRATKRIIAGELDRRIEVGGTGDEFDELAANLNVMLERIERLLAAMRQVTDDIAHDLRTPLNRLRSRLEVALMAGEPEPAAAREVLEATMRDADGLIETFNALLSIARAEAGARRSEWETVDVAALARDVHELYEPLAEDKDIALELATADGAMVRGSRQLVAQAVANLVDNAIKYGPPGSRVELRARRGAGAGVATPEVVVEVADEGPGVPPDQREHAKERFVRLDATRSTTPGSGLGLSLVDAVARLHDARFELLDNADGPGLLARLTFPEPPPAPAEQRPAGG